jgi:hypothetical protein
MIRWIKYARITAQAVTEATLETVTIKALSVSMMKAIETTARKTPKYRLALLLTKWVNSVVIVFEYLIIKIEVDATARNMIMSV